MIRSLNLAITIATFNEDDFSKVTIDDLNILSNAFLKYNVALVAITLGSSGAFLHMNDDINIVRQQFRSALGEPTSLGNMIISCWVGESNTFERPIIPEGVTLKSTVGAGDAFLAAHVKAEMLKYDPEKCLEFAVEKSAMYISE